MHFVLALIVLLLAACAPATRSVATAPEFEVADEPAPVPAPLASPIVVSIELPVSTALDRTVAAFAAEGLRVERVDREARRVRSAGVLAEAVPLAGSAEAPQQVEHFYHAMIEAAGQGSRVVLSVSMRSHRRSAAGNQTTPEAEMQECQRTDTPDSEASFKRCEHEMSQIKARLDNLARRVQATSR